MSTDIEIISRLLEKLSLPLDEKGPFFTYIKPKKDDLVDLVDKELDDI